MNTIGERIKDLRKLLRLNQKEFSAKIAINQSTLSQYERNITNPSNAVIKSIAHTFSVDVIWLKDGVGEIEDCFKRQSITAGRDATGNIQVQDSPNTVFNQKENSISPELKELFDLFIEYPIPKLIEETKEKLLKYKQIK